MRRTTLLAGLAAALALAGCGDAPTEITVNASTDEEKAAAEAIEEELDLYREPIDLSSLPPEQQAQIGEALDQFPQAAGIVDELTFEDGAVIAGTQLEAGGDSETTGRLICGAIIRGTEDRRAAHEVLDSSDQLLVRCEPADANYP